MNQRPSALPADTRINTLGDLALTLGGSPTSFTGDLLRLIAKADPINRALLAQGFPRHVIAYQIWMAWHGHQDPDQPTAPTVTELLTAVDGPGHHAAGGTR